MVKKSNYKLDYKDDKNYFIHHIREVGLVILGRSAYWGIIESADAPPDDHHLRFNAPSGIKFSDLGIRPILRPEW